ncbi:MAG TPA: glycosyltransferase, partial [Alphaproteobacteria bacterium]|nr:glycosyltransferase [Alphaproteobacteria bacterium]
MQNSQDKTLLLITGSYPFSVAGENTFVPQEIEILSRHYRKLVLVPKRIEGDCETISQKNVFTEKGYAIYINSQIAKLFAMPLLIFDFMIYREYINHAKLIFSHPRLILTILRSRLYSLMSERWFRKFISSNSWSSDSCDLLTWWFDPSTLGLLDYATSKKIPVITRAHGYDLYEERHIPPYIPFRDHAIKKICAVYTDSFTGRNYLSKKYPQFQQKIEAGLLGIKDPGYTNQASDDGIFRIQTCSFLLPVKRIDLLIKGLSELAISHPSNKFQWNHIGNGPEKENLVTLASSLLGSNIEFSFMDYPGKKELNDYYNRNPVDLFINVSKSEGTPVSIMEAISFGIPVMATSVGGNKEIVVDSRTGILIGEDPTPAFIAD